MALVFDNLTEILTQSGTSIEKVVRKSDGAILWESLPDELIVYSQIVTDPQNTATPENSSTIETYNTKYVSLTDRRAIAGQWYSDGTATSSSTITINYGGFNTAVIEYAIYDFNPDVWYEGNRRVHASVAGTKIYSSTRESNSTTYTYTTADTSIVTDVSATLDNASDSFVQIAVYPTKITLKK